MGTKLKAVDQTGVALGRKQVKEGPGNKSIGASNTRLLEPHGNFNIVGGETIFEGENNNFILLGRDRPSDANSGRGAKGYSHTSTIRLIAGLHGRDVKEERVIDKSKNKTERLFLNPDPIKDAATLYLSQQTDVDKNFHINQGGRYGSPPGRSAALLKADCIRLVGREGIKIVTGVDKKNSLNHPMKKPIGIELISGNDTSDMEPIAKGKSVAKAFEDTAKLIQQLSAIVEQQGIAIQTLALGCIPTPFGLAAFPALAPAAAVAIGFSTGAISFNATYKANLANFRELKIKYDKKKLYSRYNMTN